MVGFKYLKQIAFENGKKKKEIWARGMEALKKGNIGEEALELGEKYRGEIEAGAFAAAEVRWIGKHVGYGLYAAEELQAGVFMGEYTGIVRENDRRYLEPLNPYCYEYPVPDSLGRSHVVDATDGNWARFINHGSRPNLRPVHVFVDGFYHLIFLTLCKIRKGEQFLYDYGANYWYLRSKPSVLNKK